MWIKLALAAAVAAATPEEEKDEKSKTAVAAAAEEKQTQAAGGAVAEEEEQEEAQAALVAAECVAQTAKGPGGEVTRGEAMQVFVAAVQGVTEVLPRELVQLEQVVSAGPELLLLMQVVWAMDPMQQQQQRASTWANAGGSAADGRLDGPTRVGFSAGNAGGTTAAAGSGSVNGGRFEGLKWVALSDGNAGGSTAAGSGGGGDGGGDSIDFGGPARASPIDGNTGGTATVSVAAAAGNYCGGEEGLTDAPAWHLGLNPTLVSRYLSAASQQLAGQYQELLREMVLTLREMMRGDHHQHHQQQQQQGGRGQGEVGEGMGGQLRGAQGAAGAARGGGEAGGVIRGASDEISAGYVVHACYQPAGTPLLLPVVLLPLATAARGTMPAAGGGAAAAGGEGGGAAAAAGGGGGAAEGAAAAAGGGRGAERAAAAGGRVSSTSQSRVPLPHGRDAGTKAAFTSRVGTQGHQNAADAAPLPGTVVLLLLRETASSTNVKGHEQLMAWPWLLRVCCERGLGWRVGVLQLEEWEEVGELPQVGRQYKRQQILRGALRGAGVEV
jgi:hypothetical protein